MIWRCPCCGSAARRPDPLSVIPFSELSRRQSEIIRLLAEHFGEWVPTERIVNHVWRDDSEGGPISADNVVAVTIWRAQSRLANIGLAIESNRRDGTRRLVWADAA